MTVMGKKLNGTLFWDQRRGIIYARKGGWEIGKTVHCHGYSMMDDLMGGKSYFQVLVLNVTGRMPEPRLTQWIEARFMCVTWPDHRIWCNQIGSLAASLRTSPMAAVCGGILAADGRQYGPQTILSATDFLNKAMDDKQKGMPVEEIIERYPKRRSDGVPAIPGFNRPIASGDERISAMERVSKGLGFTPGKYLSLAYDISEVLMEKYNECMNIGAYVCGFMSDQGFSGEEHYRICATVVYSGVLACYVETYDDTPPESFFPLRCDDSIYIGKPPRQVPDKNEE